MHDHQHAGECPGSFCSRDEKSSMFQRISLTAASEAGGQVLVATQMSRIHCNPESLSSVAAVSRLTAASICVQAQRMRQLMEHKQHLEHMNNELKSLHVADMMQTVRQRTAIAGLDGKL